MLKHALALTLCALLQTQTQLEPTPQTAETVSFTTSDNVSINGELWRVMPAADDAGESEVDAPTVICLPMYTHTLASYQSLVAPLLAQGMNVLTLDLRGHGKSAPELAAGVKARDKDLFQAMQLDVEAALTFLETEGFDPTRIGLVGASVGCSVSIARTARDAGPIRGVVVMTPGANYLGIDTLADAKRWSGTPLLVLSSKEEYDDGVKVVHEAFETVASDLTMDIFPETSIHGTRMFGKVAGVEERIADWLGERLALSPRLVVPHFAADDPLVDTAGFVRRTLRVARTLDAQRYELMTFAVGETWNLGAKLQGKFKGDVELAVGSRTLSFHLDTENLPQEEVPVTLDGQPWESGGQAGSFRGWTWVSLELPLEDWTQGGQSLVKLRAAPAGGEPIDIPRSALPFDVRFQPIPKGE